MATCLPIEKGHSSLNSLPDQSAEFSIDDGPLGNGSIREQRMGTATDNKSCEYRLVPDQGPKSDTQGDNFVFTDDELVELELLRDQESDILVD